MQISVEPQILFGRSFAYGFASGDPWVTSLQFCQDGTVTGYDHPNERRWVLDGDGLRFLSEAGEPTSTFPTMELKQDLILFHGSSLTAPDLGAPLVLMQVKPPAPAVPPPASAPAPREPGTRREPDGPPQVAGMAWPWAMGNSPFARRNRFRKRPVVG